MNGFRLGWIAALQVVLFACAESSPERAFSVSEWREAAPKERRQMAAAFLRQHDVVGMSEARLRELLGEPASEDDAWIYDLTENGPPPPGPQPSQVFMKHPQLYVFFRQGRVHSVSPTYKLELRNDAVFDPRFWAPHTSARLAMAYDLLERRLLTALDKPGVAQLLGAPDHRTERRTLSYDLGMRMVDPVTLSFTLDSLNRITQARIREH